MRFVRYKDSAPVNLENIVWFNRSDEDKKFSIIFVTDDLFRVMWVFKEEEERDKVFKALLTQSSTINIVI